MTLQYGSCFDKTGNPTAIKGKDIMTTWKLK